MVKTVSEMLAPAPIHRLRLRPGERPVWIDTSRWSWDPGAWLADALDRQIAVDVTVGVALEYAVLLDDLREMGVGAGVDPLGGAVERELQELRLPPNRDLREWCALLDGKQPDRGDWDELPEVVLSQRVMHSVPRNRALADHLRLAIVDRAIDCERAAAARGMTLQAWGLRSALASAVGR